MSALRLATSLLLSALRAFLRTGDEVAIRRSENRACFFVREKGKKAGYPLGVGREGGNKKKVCFLTLERGRRRRNERWLSPKGGAAGVDSH